MSSEFEVIFLQDGVRYRYGFEILPSHIIIEWLYKKGKDGESEIFYRNQPEFQCQGRGFTFLKSAEISKRPNCKK